jgi:hypothetical protein
MQSKNRKTYPWTGNGWIKWKVSRRPVENWTSFAVDPDRAGSRGPPLAKTLEA